MQSRRKMLMTTVARIYKSRIEIIWINLLCEVRVLANAMFVKVNNMNKKKKKDLPSPMLAFTPPRFLTRKSPLFLNAQLSINPKSDSKTHVESPCWTKPAK